MFLPLRFLELTTIVLILLYPTLTISSEKPQVQLAKTYNEALDIRHYLVSEKYDGVRAIWKDGKLKTRNGRTINAPNWFTNDLPDNWLDGELWSKRSDFEFVISAVNKKTPIDHEWQKLTYMVFDAPNHNETFYIRAQQYTALLNKLALDHVKPVKQFRVSNNSELSAELESYTKAGAEGLMLHRAGAKFEDGRTNNLMKLKPYMDAEARVLKHIPGKGKYKGSMGALLVETLFETLPNSNESIIFKIGTGFSDNERENPPAIGNVITFKYHGLTKNNVPKFASYLRQREAD